VKEQNNLALRSVWPSFFCVLAGQEGPRRNRVSGATVKHGATAVALESPLQGLEVQPLREVELLSVERANVPIFLTNLAVCVTLI